MSRHSKHRYGLRHWYIVVSSVGYIAHCTSYQRALHYAHQLGGSVIRGRSAAGRAILRQIRKTWASNSQ